MPERRQEMDLEHEQSRQLSGHGRSMEKDSKIFVAGRMGLVGSAIERVLKSNGYENIIGKPHTELNLTNQAAVERFFGMEQPEYVFLAAAIVGGIHANNTYPADFIYSNLEIQNNIIHSCYLYKVKKLLFLGSSCIYPKYANQPMSEDELLAGKLEPTNKPYAIAKIAGIVMCESYNRQYGTDFISAMPTNLYGPNDNYHPMNSHVLPALIRRFHEAKLENRGQVVIWGSGSPLREFLYSDDLADACLFLMQNHSGNEIVNIGSGEEVSIRDLAHKVGQAVGYRGEIIFDTSKPDGTQRKFLDVSRLLRMGWKPRVSLGEGIRLAYEDFINNPGIRK